MITTPTWSRNLMNKMKEKGAKEEKITLIFNAESKIPFFMVPWECDVY